MTDEAFADRRPQTESLAQEVAAAYERACGRAVLDVGHYRDGTVREAVATALVAAGHDPTPRCSCDLLSTSEGEAPRFIEVKGRGLSGPIDVIDREYETAQRLGVQAWLYVVFGCSTDTQELLVARDWSSLLWARTQEADPARANDTSFPGFPDRRKRSRRDLDCEGSWRLAMWPPPSEFVQIATYCAGKVLPQCRGGAGQASS